MAGIDLRMYIDQVEKITDRPPRCSNCQYYDEKINSCNCDDWNKDCPLARFVKENKIFYSKLQKNEPERKVGKWKVEYKSEQQIGALNLRYRVYECPFCGWDNSLIIPRNFCPKCGADMRGKNAETN